MILKPKYSPGEKVSLISGGVWWINFVSIFNRYYTYNVWDGDTKFLSMDEWQIGKSLKDEPLIGYEVHFDNLSGQQGV